MPCGSSLRGDVGGTFEPLKIKFGFGSPKLITASCLDTLQTIPTASIDTVITSPPYANRYGLYALLMPLELAWLGYEQDHFASLRQDFAFQRDSRETSPKMAWLRKSLRWNLDYWITRIKFFSEQDAISETIETLERTKNELSNPNIIRLIEGYFSGDGLLSIAELSRIVVPAGTVYMVNDNVQYHGEEVPVDLILSDFAERSGFECDSIWLLARGKGNSSQQMGRFGRTEIRKCLYKWVPKIMTRLKDATYRSQLLSQRIRQRTDVDLRQLIEKFQQKLNFQPIEDLMISSEAWIFVGKSGIQPHKVFVHPDLLLSHPEASAYYRGIALLPQKRVAELAVPVNSWERKGQQAHVSADKVKRVVRLYNTVISSIIEGTTDWTMENGYRNVIATMAIGFGWGPCEKRYREGCRGSC